MKGRGDHSSLHLTSERRKERYRHLVFLRLIRSHQTLFKFHLGPEECGLVIRIWEASEHGGLW
jgi:hypothetical protein